MPDRFNPDPFRGTTQEQPSFLGRSKGRSAEDVAKTTADSSFSSALSSATEFGLSAIGVVDQEFQGQQRREFQSEFENVQNEFGVADATNLEVTAGTAVPKDIERSRSELDRMSKARAAGQLKESAYWARLNSVVRQMRARWPGYRDQIDKMVSGITGATPANALRSALQRERDQAARQAAGRASSLEKQHIRANFRMAELGLTVRDWSKLSITSKLNKIRDYQAFDAGIKRQTQLLALDKTKNSLNQDNAESVASQAAALEYSNGLDAFLPTDFREKLEELKKKQDSGQTISAAESGKIRSTLDTAKSAILGKIQTRVNSFVRGGLLNVDRSSKIISFYEGQLDSTIKAFSEGDAVGIDYNVNLLNSLKSEAGSKLAQKYPFLTQFSNIRQFLGENTTSFSLVQNLDEVQRRVVQIGTSLTFGKQPVVQVLREMDKLGSDTKSKSVYLQQLGRALTNAKSNDDTIKAISTSVFGNGSADFLDSIDPKDHYRVYSMFANPSVTNNLFKQRDTNPEVWDTYKEWVLKNSAYLIRRFAPDIREANENRTFLSAEFDVKSSQWIVTDKKGGRNTWERWLEGGSVRRRDLDVFNKVNQISRNLSKVFDLEGRDTSVELPQFILTHLELAGVDVDADEKGNWFTKGLERTRQKIARERAASSFRFNVGGSQEPDLP